MKTNNETDGKCLSCHVSLEDGYYFCSITCACLCGYMSVKANTKVKNIKELKDKKIRDKFLNNPPLRVRDKKYI